MKKMNERMNIGCATNSGKIQKGGNDNKNSKIKEDNKKLDYRLTNTNNNDNIKKITKIYG
jgi:hypothetical protein